MNIEKEIRRFSALKKKDMQDFMKEKNKDIPAFKDRMRTAGNVPDILRAYRQYLERQELEEEGDDSNADDVGESSKSAARTGPSRKSRTSSAETATTTEVAATDEAGDKTDTENSIQDSDSMSENIVIKSKQSTSRSTFPPNDQVNWPNSFSAKEQATVRKHVKEYLSDKPLLYTKQAKQDGIHEAAHHLADNWPLAFGKTPAVAQLAFFDVVCKQNNWDWPYPPPDEAASSDAAPDESEDEGAEDEDTVDASPKKSSKAAGKRPLETAESDEEEQPVVKSRRILRGHVREEERGRARIGHKATSAP